MKTPVTSLAMILICLAATAIVARADSAPVTEPPSPSLARQLADAYETRCRAEVHARSATLTTLDAELKKDVAVGSTLRALDAAENARASGPAIRAMFAELLRVPDKYSAWARDAKLPDPFQLDNRTAADELRGTRWEALRPQLLPVWRKLVLLGWNDPRGDAKAWTDSPTALPAELFQLLNWLAHAPKDAPAADESWVRGELADTSWPAWRKAPRNSRSFLRGQYTYTQLTPPANTVGLPPRIGLLTERMAWRGGFAPAAFASFVSEKDKLLIQLAELIAADNRADPLAVEIFSCTARWYPFFNRHRPEASGTAVRAMFARDEREEQVFAALRDLPDLAERRQVWQAIFQYQVTAMRPDDENYEAPVRGYSGNILWPTDAPPGASSVAANSSTDAPAAALMAAPAGFPIQTTPEQACQQVSRAAAQSLAHLNQRANAPLYVTVDHRCGAWLFAFGADELAQVLRQNPAFAGREVIVGPPPIAAPGDHFHVKVTDVSPGDSVTVGFSLNGDDVGGGRVVIPGPWPKWFAIAMYPTRILQPAWILGLLVLGPAIRLWLSRRSTRARGGLFVALLLCAVAGIAVVCWSARPEPSMTAEMGGQIVAVIPADASVPPGMKRIMRQSVLALHDEIASKAGGCVMPPAQSWGRRYVSALGDMMRQARTCRFDQPAGNTPVSGLRFKLEVTRAGPVESIPAVLVGPDGRQRLTDALDGVVYKGEADVPRGDAPPGSTATLARVVFTEGDPNALSPPAPTRFADAPTLGVMPQMPSRDLHEDRGLQSAVRVEWCRKAFRQTLLLTRGGVAGPRLVDVPRENVENAAAGLERRWCDESDRCASTPADMDALRGQWSDDAITKSDAQKIGAQIASRALANLDPSRQQFSRTMLRQPPNAQRRTALCVVAIGLILAGLFKDRRGIVRLRLSTVIGRIVQSLCVAAIIVLAVPALTGITPVVWALGDAYAVGFLLAAVAVAACVSATALLFVLLRHLTRHSPATVRILGAKAALTLTPWRRSLHGLSRGAGAVLVACALAWLLILPLSRVNSAVLPTDYATSVMLAMAALAGGFALMWTSPGEQIIQTRSRT